MSEVAGMKFQSSKVGSSKGEPDPSWFDEECKNEKENLKSLGRQICNAPDDNDLRNKLFSKKKKFKQLCKSKKARSTESKINSLDFKNPRKVWRELKYLFQVGKSKTKQVCPVEINDFYDHFENLNNASAPDLEIPSSSIDQGPLDFEITTKEVSDAIKNLKTGKVPGHDNILNEIIKYSQSGLIPYLTKLFNIILSSGEFPQKWNLGFIIPIFKKGDRSVADNYRGITLLSALSKLFTSVLNKRLNEYLISRGVLKKEQGGFRKKHSTIDSVFVLKSVIDKLVKSKPKKKNNLLFSCFVDFRKAFDSISREKLFSKIQQVGISGNFYEILRSMYLNDKSVVKIDNRITESFSCKIGIKQGCMLSPTLFNLFISDLPNELARSQEGKIQIGDIDINCLLYADDLVLLSNSRAGLQDLLNRLESYSCRNGLEINLAKTKVIVFNNSGKTMNNHKFYFATKQLENARFYKYLGITLSPFGNFSLAKQEIKKTALKALFKLRKDMGVHFRSDVKLTTKLFDTLINPILLYGSEIWGVDGGLKQNDPIESVHLKFCKMLLGTSKAASNNACRAELGQYPVKLLSTFRSIKYWTNLVTKEDTALSKLVYAELKLSTKATFWTEKVKIKIFSLGFGFVWLSQDEITEYCEFLKRVKLRLQDIEQQQWQSDMFNDSRKNPDQGNKLRTFRTFKNNYELEKYLVNIPNVKHRIALTRLRVSNHNLQIERGRYLRPYVKPEDRICPTCKENVEDEFHFAVNCKTYNVLRSDFLQALNSSTKIKLNNMTDNKIFKLVINPSAEAARFAAKFVYKSFQLRSSLV